MNINDVKSINPMAFSSMDHILIWQNHEIRSICPNGNTEMIPYEKAGMALENESIDKIIIHCSKDFELEPEAIIYEAKRVLRKNGRIFLSFYHDEEIGFISKWLTKIRAKNRWSMDHVVEIINRSDLLIDKNIIVENDLMYFEVIKLENEKLGKLIFSS